MKKAYTCLACCLIQWRNLFKWENKWFFLFIWLCKKEGELNENSCIGNHATQNFNLNTLFWKENCLYMQGVDSKTGHKCSCMFNLWNWLLINVHVYWYQICISLFQLLNSSSLSIDYCIKLDSLSLERHNIAQAVPAFIQANKTTKLSVGKWTNHFFHQRIKSIEQTFLHVLSQPIY